MHHFLVIKVPCFLLLTMQIEIHANKYDMFCYPNRMYLHKNENDTRSVFLGLVILVNLRLDISIREKYNVLGLVW